MTSKECANYLSYLLYERRLFPYLCYSIIGGFNNLGKTVIMLYLYIISHTSTLFL
jgi:20S proteasome alpha/beta subunit